VHAQTVARAGRAEAVGVVGAAFEQRIGESAKPT